MGKFSTCARYVLVVAVALVSSCEAWNASYDALGCSREIVAYEECASEELVLHCGDSACAFFSSEPCASEHERAIDCYCGCSDGKKRHKRTLLELLLRLAIVALFIAMVVAFVACCAYLQTTTKKALVADSFTPGPPSPIY